MVHKCFPQKFHTHPNTNANLLQDFFKASGLQGCSVMLFVMREVDKNNFPELPHVESHTTSLCYKISEQGRTLWCGYSVLVKITEKEGNPIHPLSDACNSPGISVLPVYISMTILIKSRKCPECMQIFSYNLNLICISHVLNSFHGIFSKCKGKPFQSCTCEKGGEILSSLSEERKWYSACYRACPGVGREAQSRAKENILQCLSHLLSNLI